MRIPSDPGLTIHFDPDELHLVVRGPAGEEMTADIEAPPEGIAGYEVVVSPRQTYAALMLYSGQSEVGYGLFRLRPRLEHLVSLPYQPGEALPPMFSEDERHFALPLTIDPLLTGAGSEGGEWARLLVRSLPSGALERCFVFVRPTPSAGQIGSGVHLSIDEFGSELVVSTPWGTRRALPLPLPESLELEGPGPAWTQRT